MEQIDYKIMLCGVKNKLALNLFTYVSTFETHNGLLNLINLLKEKYFHEDDVKFLEKFEKYIKKGKISRFDYLYIIDLINNYENLYLLQDFLKGIP